MLGAVLLIVASGMAPSLLPFCTLQVEWLQWKFGPSLGVAGSHSSVSQCLKHPSM